MPDYLFVYGSLRKGCQAHLRYLRNCEMVKSARVAGYDMYTYMRDGYPFIVRGDRGIVGEVYEVSQETLMQLDEYEDCPRLYLREHVDIDGMAVWIYVFNNRPRPDATLVENGDWIEFTDNMRMTNIL